MKLRITLINGGVFEFENDRYTFEYWDNGLVVTDTMDDSVTMFPWTSVLYFTKEKVGKNETDN